MIFAMRPWFLGLALCVASSAAADPFRWQASDGTRVEAEVVATPGEAPRLVVTKPSPATIELVGAVVGDQLRVDSIRDDLVIVGRNRAWRLAWKQDGFAQVASAKWTDPRRQASWTQPRKLTNYHVAFEEMRQLLRFEGTRPGLERFLGDAPVTISYSDRRASETLPGRELLARWKRDGFPLARGTVKTAGERCASLPINYAGYRDAKTPKGPLLLMACFAKDLQLARITLTVED